MKVELVQDVVHQIRPFTVPVYLMKGITGGPDRQCGYIESLTVGRNGGDARSDAKEDVAELAQLLHCTIDILRTHPPRIKGRLRVIENYQGLLAGQEWT